MRLYSTRYRRWCQPDVPPLSELKNPITALYRTHTEHVLARLSPSCRHGALALVTTIFGFVLTCRSRSVVPTARSKNISEDEPDCQPSRGGAERRNAIQVWTREPDSIEAFFISPCARRFSSLGSHTPHCRYASPHYFQPHPQHPQTRECT